MKILITGGSGQLGRELETVLATGVAEIGAISSQYQNAQVVSVDMDILDISDLNSVTQFFCNKQFDIIFNCAAFTNVDLCESESCSAMKANALGPLYMARAAEKTGSKIVHISTDYVFSGKERQQPYAEWDSCMPETVYGKSKLLGERNIEQFSTKAFIVRTAWLYGEYGHNFVKTIQRLAKEKNEIKVVGDQFGCPTNANDLAYHLLEIVLTEEYGLYHCTGQGECSWFDFAKKIVALSSLDCTVKECSTLEFPRPAKRPAYSVLANLRLDAQSQNKMRYWETALESYIERTSKS